MVARFLRLLVPLCVLWGALAPAEMPSVSLLRVHSARQSPTDLEVAGMFAALPQGGTGYITRDQLLSLPQVPAHLVGDENFPPGVSVEVRGVRLEVLTERLGESPQADVIALPCSDGYRAHLTREFVAAHHPILALTINGMLPEVWAARTHNYDPGPYFITYEHFQQSFQVLSHKDYAQVPANITAIRAATAAETFGPITPHVTSVAVQQGFTIAKQNCLRCHSQGTVGGTKSSYTWNHLAQVASEKPNEFIAYVHDPKAVNPKAKMPANPSYDARTLEALRVYFAALSKPMTP